jgi:hypothetical protein
MPWLRFGVTPSVLPQSRLHLRPGRRINIGQVIGVEGKNPGKKSLPVRPAIAGGKACLPGNRASEKAIAVAARNFQNKKTVNDGTPRALKSGMHLVARIAMVWNICWGCAPAQGKSSVARR